MSSKAIRQEKGSFLECTIAANCMQAFMKAAFFAAIFGTVLALFIAGYKDTYEAMQSLGQDLLQNGFHRELIKKGIVSDVMTLALPIISALPYTASLIDDLRTGFVKQYLPRTSKNAYIAGKMTAGILSGGGAPALGMLFFYGMSLLFFLPMEAALPDRTFPKEEVMGILFLCLLLFASGALWSLVGMTMSVLTGNKYMAYASPFIFYYVMIILCERYFKTVYVLSPKEWLRPEDWTYGVWGILTIIAELAGLTGIVFAVSARRRTEEL